MEAKNRYTFAEMQETLCCLMPLFDVVRIVDPAETAVVTLEDDGKLHREPYTCFRVWNKDCRCRNCTSMQAAMGNCRRTKYEFMQEGVFYVLSQPLLLVSGEESCQVVLEVVSHVSDQLLLEKESNGKSLADHLNDIQEKLYRDELTRAFNRRYLNEFTFLHRGQEHVSKQVGLILMDLRQFKSINDTQGHLAGDRTLEEVAHVLKTHVRSQDSVVRLGGDEFLVILTGCGEEAVRCKIQDLRVAVGRVAPADFWYAYTDAFQIDQEFLIALMDEADRRMYAEKQCQAE